MSAHKLNCLIVLSSAKEGVSAPSFIQCFSVTHISFNVQICTPAGKEPEFIHHNEEQNRRWLNDFRTKSFSIPMHLAKVDANRFSSLIIPHSPGAPFDLATDKHLKQILQHFVREKKPICAVGLGVAALFAADDEDKAEWSFMRYAMTSSPVIELARLPTFLHLPLVPEDVIKDRGAVYSCSEANTPYVVVDRHLVTGQNEQSTLTAVQNLVLLCNLRSGAKTAVK